MTIVAADSMLAQVWPTVWPFLEPAVKRSPERPDVLARLRAHDAQLWTVCENGAPIAAVVTMIKHHEGESRCLLWLLGGSRVREWAAEALASIAAWARSIGCVALWACGRRGWDRFAPAYGFRRIADCDGLPAWERRAP